MAKYRTIQNTYWADDYIYHLSPNGKLLFCFLLTNSFVDNLGIANLQEPIIAAYTKIPQQELQQLLATFEKDGKIIREKSTILVTNFIKHQTNNIEKNNNVLKGLQSDFDNLKVGKIREELCKRYAFFYSKEATTKGLTSDLQAPPTKEREKEKEKEKEMEMEKETTEPQPPVFTIENCVAGWNGFLEKNDFPETPPKVVEITQERRRKFEEAQKKYAQYGADKPEFWGTLFNVIRNYKNGLLVGGVPPKPPHKKSFVCTFDWIFKDGNIAKLLEEVGDQ